MVWDVQAPWWGQKIPEVQAAGQVPLTQMSTWDHFILIPPVFLYPLPTSKVLANMPLGVVYLLGGEYHM